MQYETYPVFKGLQQPLQLFGLQGRFLVYAAVIIASIILGFLLGYALLGAATGCIIALFFIIVGGTFFVMQYKRGLHTKKTNKDIYIYKNIYVTYK